MRCHRHLQGGYLAALPLAGRLSGRPSICRAVIRPPVHYRHPQETAMAGRSRPELLRLQHEALSLLEEGNAVEEVAKRLGVSPRTVRRWRGGPATAKPPSPDRHRSEERRV